MTGELERILKEDVVTYYPWSFQDGLRRTTKALVRITEVPAQIRSGKF
jgi:hypothetical protein